MGRPIRSRADCTFANFIAPGTLSDARLRSPSPAESSRLRSRWLRSRPASSARSTMLNEPPKTKSKPAASPSIAPSRRDTRARVSPGGDDGRAGRSTFQSTAQTRIESDGDGDDCSHRAPSWMEVWWQGIRKRYAFWGRYSVGKLQAFSDYQQQHSLTRTVVLLCAMSLPSIVVLIVLLAIPLQSPALGPAHNSAAFARSFVSHIGASFCITLVVKQALEFSDRVYPYWWCLIMACLASGTNETLWTVLSFLWRFPIPFREVLCANTWLFWFLFYHYVTMRGHFALKKRRMRIYLPVFTVQFGMFYVFLGLAVLFTYLGLAGQVALVLFVPPVKVYIKRLFWRLTKQLDDLSTDVTVCVVEISASMYQCLVMQYAASPAIPVLFFVVDVLQAAVEIALFVDHSFLVRGETAIAVAVDIIAHARVVEAKRLGQMQDSQPNTSSHVSAKTGIKSVASACEGGKRSVASFSSPVPGAEGSRRESRRSSTGLLKMAEAAVEAIHRQVPTGQFLDFRPGNRGTPNSVEPANPQIVDGLPIPRLTDARLLTQLLRLLFATEMLVFVEFIEVVLALLYVVVFGLASVLPGGTYVVSLMDISDHDFRYAMTNAGLYLALEIVSFALVLWLLRRKCGLSTVYQVAYVMEHYWMTIQGKVVTCLLLLLNLATQHQGTDFTFQFLKSH